jgi:hypothetical protein
MNALSDEQLAEAARRYFQEKADEHGRLHIDMPLTLLYAVTAVHADTVCQCGQPHQHVQRVLGSLQEDPLLAAEDEARQQYCLTQPHC